MSEALRSTDGSMLQLVKLPDNSGGCTTVTGQELSDVSCCVLTSSNRNERVIAGKLFWGHYDLPKQLSASISAVIVHQAEVHREENGEGDFGETSESRLQ